MADGLGAYATFAMPRYRDGMSNAVPWSQIERGWKVADADGRAIGVVAEIAGDAEAGIFEGIAVRTMAAALPRWVPADGVARIVAGEVQLAIAVPDASRLESYPPPAQPQDGEPRDEVQPGGGSPWSWLRRQFGAKRVGFGFRPVTWQGWLIWLGFLAVVVLAVLRRRIGL